MSVEIRVKVAPNLEWGVMSDSFHNKKQAHILIPAEDIEHLTDSEIGAMARMLVEKARFASALNFADNIQQNASQSKYVPEQLLDGNIENIAHLEQFAGKDGNVDRALEIIQNTKQHIAEQKLKVSTRKKSSPARREIHASYDSFFVAIGRRDGFYCQHCMKISDLQIDHVHPVSLGGGNELENLQLLCKTCNTRKGNKL